MHMYSRQVPKNLPRYSHACFIQGKTSGGRQNSGTAGRSVIEGAHIHIFGFTNRENNQFQRN